MPSRPGAIAVLLASPTLGRVYASWAESLAERLLADGLPSRWVHSCGVGRKARELRTLAGEHADILEAAAFVHDIGYAPELVDTGFHSLDGARYLRDNKDAPPLLCMLVANHTGALVEAGERGLGAQLVGEFPVGKEPEPLLIAAITYCDLSVGPTGEPTTPKARLEEILERYPPEHVVHRSIKSSRTQLLQLYTSIAARMV